MEIKVLGTGCCSCGTTIKLIEQVAKEKGVAVVLQKVDDLQQIMSYGVMSTPGVVIDGKVVHAGGTPGREKIEKWLSGAAAAAVQGAETGCCGSVKPAANGGGCCGA